MAQTGTLTINFDVAPDKFRELVLYVAQKCADDSRFGATKLNKILFFADFLAYAKYGEPITNAAYIKLPFGPGAKPMAPVREEMLSNNEIAIERRERFGRTQERIVALREPDLSGFTATEIALVDDIIESLWELTASQVSQITHGLRGWKVAPDGADIPYEAVFLSDEGLTDYDTSHARDLIREHGWNV